MLTNGRSWFRRVSAPWESADIWTPAPKQVVLPPEAGIDLSQLTMPQELDRFDAPPVLICGSARSGTTWTLDLFERHPLVCAVYESWILSQTHGVTSILTQHYWHLEAKQALEERLDVPFGAVQLIGYGDLLNDLGALTARWFVRAAKPEHRFLVAKEPLDVLAAAILYPEARFIHVVRDGRDVVLSMRRASRSWDPTMGVGLPVSHHALGWKRNVVNIRAHRHFLEGRYLEVRYEDLRKDPIEAMRAMFDFAEIPYDGSLLESIRVSTQLESYGEVAATSGFRGGGEGRSWRDEFSARDAIGFHRSAGDLLVELGYEPDSQWWRSQIRRRIALG